MKIRIIEDDPNDLCRIQSQLSLISRQLNIPMQIKAYSNQDDIPYNEPVDCYIVDIQLKDTDGFTICGNIREHDTESVIIFCSHHEELVFHSFRYDIFSFVRKNNLAEDLKEAVNRLAEHLSSDLYYIYSNRADFRKIPYRDILFFESVGNDLYIYLINGEVLRQRKSLVELMKEVSADQFIQLSRNYVVYKKAISVVTSENVTIKDDRKLPISRSQRQKVINSYFKMK